MYTGREKTSEKRGIYLFLSFFLLFLGRSFQQLNFEWYRQKLLAGKQKENCQMINEDFYLPLYLPLCLNRREYCSKYQNAVFEQKYVLQQVSKRHLCTQECTAVQQVSKRHLWTEESTAASAQTPSLNIKQYSSCRKYQTLYLIKSTYCSKYRNHGYFNRWIG